MSTVQINGPQRSRSIDISWRCVLDSVVYRFRLKYRVRYDCWDMQISQSDGTVVLDGFRVTEGNDMLAPYTDTRLPAGQLICVDTQGLGTTPTRNDWIERHVLTYTSPVAVDFDNDLRSEPAGGPFL
jgi:hypothetical protein